MRFHRHEKRRQQRGLGMIAAIVVLVILAALAGAIASLGASQQFSSALDVQSARAWQSAKAGGEWGLYHAIKALNWPGAGSPCSAATLASPVSETLDLSADTDFHVTVSCGSVAYNEGENADGTPIAVRLYQITAVACNATACPAADASAPTYVERRRVVLAQ